MPRLEHASDTENEHSDDSAGEKEAKRQRSEPTTPVSTSSRHPYEYDALMGITRVGTKEAERFEEDLDSTEYHDATEEPIRKEETEEPHSKPRPGGFQGGYGSSSLKECIELLNATTCNAPAPLDSGVGQKTTDPSQVMSPSMEGSLAEADAQPSSGSISQATSRVKDEPQSRAERDPVIETKPDSGNSTLDVKSEQKESERKEETTTSVKQEERTPEPDSEDSLTAERVAEMIHRLSDIQGPRVSCSCAARNRRGSNSATDQLPEKERLLQKTLENKAMVLMLHKEQEEREEDIARQIRFCSVILSFWNTIRKLVQHGMTRCDSCKID